MSLQRISTRWIFLSLAVVLASCGGVSTNGEPVSTTTSEVPAFDVQPIEWAECDDGSEVTLISCGTLEVPFDYEQPDKGSFVLYIKKREASGESVGPLLVNPGGPGFGGSSLANDAMYYFSKTLLDSFDIIAWDPRGTGLTTPSVDCVDDYDQYFGLDSPPDDENERQALILSLIHI